MIWLRPERDVGNCDLTSNPGKTQMKTKNDVRARISYLSGKSFWASMKFKLDLYSRNDPYNSHVSTVGKIRTKFPRRWYCSLAMVSTRFSSADNPCFPDAGRMSLYPAEDGLLFYKKILFNKQKFSPRYIFLLLKSNEFPAQFLLVFTTASFVVDLLL